MNPQNKQYFAAMRENMPEKIVHHMLEHDAFSKWLGIRVLNISQGKVILEMTIREEMTNGFGIAHGGITFSLADSALAFAANTHGMHSLTVDASINHLAPLKANDTIKAVVEELNTTSKTGLYRVDITLGEKLVAHFKGLVYRKQNDWKIS